MNKIFAMLPSEVRRALSRRELARRGLSPSPAPDDPKPLLRFADDDALERLEAVLVAHPNARSTEDFPPEAAAEMRQLLSIMVKATRDRCKDIATREMDETLALAGRLEAGLQRAGA